jgi:hypothetical protein
VKVEWREERKKKKNDLFGSMNDIAEIDDLIFIQLIKLSNIEGDFLLLLWEANI